MRLLRAALLVAAALSSPCAGARWGVTAEFANYDPVQSEYEAPALAQRGVNCVFLNQRGADYNWPDWVRVQAAWDGCGVSCFWELASTPAQYERILGFAPGPFKTEDIFDPDFAFQGRKVAAAMARRLKTPSGWQVGCHAPLPTGSPDQHALASWQSFLKSFTGDSSPAEDTNADTVTFNSAFSTDYASWDQAQQFTSADTSDPRRRRLADMWLAASCADYVDGICEAATSPDDKALAGPQANSAVRGSADASVLLSRAHVNVVYTDSAEDAPALDSVAAAFGKRVFANGIPLVPGDYNASRQRALKLLPYVSGACFDYGGLVAQRTKPLSTESGLRGEPRPYGKQAAVQPAEITAFDLAFRVIPELAPFAGKFRIQRANVLWILGDVGKEDTGCIFNAYCVSEQALALDPDCVDLTRFKAVIYRSLSPPVSTVVTQKLLDYTLAGGMVFVDAYRIGSGPTLLGRDNSRFYRQDISLARGSFGEGETTVSYGGRQWKFGFTAPYLTGAGGTLRQSGQVRDSTGANYPLLLVRDAGRSGKWVFVNLPSYDSQFSLLKEIVLKQSGVALPDRAEAQVYRGEDCVLAVGGAERQGVAIKTPHARTVAFDIATGEISIGEGGEVVLPGEAAPGEARLWVVKPYGQPVVLYSDGTTNHGASTDDGDYADNVLRFTFAERAYISCPTKPKSLRVNGQAAEFEYDPQRHLVTIKRTGPTAPAELEFEK